MLRRAAVGAAVSLLALLICPAARADSLWGWASWYGEELAGRPTASGESFDPDELTCAHRWLPFGTWLHVERLGTSLSSLARVNDRGPWIAGRILDLSQAVMARLDGIEAGVIWVRATVIDSPDPTGSTPQHDQAKQDYDQER